MPDMAGNVEVMVAVMMRALSLCISLLHRMD